MAGLMRMTRIREVVIGTILATTLFLFVFLAGCSKDKRSVAGLCDCDSTAPLVGALSPVCGTTGVVLNQKIRVVFDKPMESSTITTGTFSLAGPGGTAVTGTVTYVSSSYIATFTPGSNLAPSTTYTYTVKGGTGGVRRVAGNALVSDLVCGFTTGAAPDLTAGNGRSVILAGGLRQRTSSGRSAVQRPLERPLP